MRFYSEILATVSLFLLQSSTASRTPRLIPRLESLNKAYNKAPVTTKPGAGEGVRSWSNAYAAPTSRPAAAGLASAAGALHGTSRPVSTAALLGGSQSTPQPTGGPTLNSNFTAGQGEDKLKCPMGGTWQVWYDDFKTLDPAHWKTEESAKSFISHDEDGLTMTISQAMQGIAVQSTSTWRAPLTMSLVAKTDGAPGIVDAFILKPEKDTGEEIDLEIAGATFQVPVWTNGEYRLRKTGKETLEGPKDLDQLLFNGAKETGAYFYRYDGKEGYDPKVWVTYRLSWELDHISWAVGPEGMQKQRVRFGRLSDNYPLGPLPLRFGPWATDPATADWAGRTDWAQNPNPTFQVKSFRIEGCRAT